jgi:hypothetical protein
MWRAHRRLWDGRQRFGGSTSDFAGKRAPARVLRFIDIDRYNPVADNVRWRVDQRLLVNWRTFRLLIHNGHTQGPGVANPVTASVPDAYSILPAKGM